jgi:hypothetical protein
MSLDPVAPDVRIPAAGTETVSNVMSRLFQASKSGDIEFVKEMLSSRNGDHIVSLSNPNTVATYLKRSILAHNNKWQSLCDTGIHRAVLCCV